MRTKTLCEIVLYVSDITVIYCSLIVGKWGGAEGAEITLPVLKVLEMSFEQQEVTMIWAEKNSFLKNKFVFRVLSDIKKPMICFWAI